MLKPEFIYFIGFIIFTVLALYYGYRKSIRALDTKIDEIKEMLKAVEHERTVAENALNAERNKEIALQQEILEMVNSTTHQINDLKVKTDNELKALLELREENVRHQLEGLRNDSLNQLKSYVVTKTVDVIQQFFKDHLNSKTRVALNDSAIDHLAKVVKEV